MSGSTGEGLGALAVRENADLVVFGSDWHTAPGHVQPGQSALRLLEGGPASIAIAAAGLRNKPDARLRAHAKHEGWRIRDYRTGRKAARAGVFTAAVAGAATGAVAAGLAVRRRR